MSPTPSSGKKVVLITGTSRGIGKATAEHLESQGYIVYGSSRSPHAGERMLQIQITDPASCQRAVDEVVRREGRIDVLVNNAAYELVGAHEEFTVDELRDNVEVNFFGAVHMMKAITPVMLEQRSGSIINISSIGSDVGWAFNSAYSAGKFALHGYSEAVRRELLPFHVFVSIVSPAGVASGTTHLSVKRSASSHPLFERASAAAFEYSSQGGDLSMASSMESVATAVQKAIEARRPPFMYRVGFVPRLMMFMKTVLPQRAFESFYMSVMKVPRTAPKLAPPRQEKISS
jgi:NAD(P)-dependent dehydrogenase (short-subunit alcohol dehydrogenase family)